MSSIDADAGPDRSLLDRFTNALSRIVHDERPEALGRSITVAELYQDIAPYRRMRELAGMEIHADYEHALIRFLSGEGGHARLDPETAADELGIEAESSDPDLSLYRKFAACDVRLSLPRPAPLEEPVPRPVPPPAPPIAELAARAAEEARAEQIERERAEREEAERAQTERLERERRDAVERLRSASRPATAASVEETLRALHPQPAAPGRAPAGRAAPPETRCAFCGQGLPSGRDVRYCPHCGVDQNTGQCGSCGVEMEAGWRFCIACGAAAES